jgi:hypothetical protein
MSSARINNLIDECSRENFHGTILVEVSKFGIGSDGSLFFVNRSKVRDSGSVRSGVDEPENM